MSTRSLDTSARLGRYKLLGQLAESRFGAIWLAHSEPPGIAGPGACVCIKELRGAPAEVLDEVRHAMRITHRNVCASLELNKGERPFLAMEYLQGGTYAELPRDPDLVAGIAMQVREGLRAAHAYGVVHGALTADKVFVTADGRAVILGFGTSRSVPGTAPLIEHDLASVTKLFGEPSAAAMPESQIGSFVRIACAARISHDRALGATERWVVR